MEDGSSSSVATAQIALTNTATGVVTTRDTGEEGYAVFSPVARGNYTAEIRKAGFQTTKVTGLSLQVDDVAKTIEVSAAADIVQSEQAALGQVIRGTVAVELPVAARRYTDLALLVPGATESTVSTRHHHFFCVAGLDAPDISATPMAQHEYGHRRS